MNKLHVNAKKMTLETYTHECSQCVENFTTSVIQDYSPFDMHYNFLSSDFLFKKISKLYYATCILCCHFTLPYISEHNFPLGQCQKSLISLDNCKAKSVGQCIH